MTATTCTHQWADETSEAHACHLPAGHVGLHECGEDPDCEATEIPEVDEQCSPSDDERIRVLTETLLLARDTLQEARGLADLFDDLYAWQDGHRLELSVSPPPVEGSTVPCRICGEVIIEGVPTTTGHTVRVSLPHDHFAYITIGASSTLPGTGAFCARCVTHAALTVLTDGKSWAGEKFLSGPENGSQGPAE